MAGLVLEMKVARGRVFHCVGMEPVRALLSALKVVRLGMEAHWVGMDPVREFAPAALRWVPMVKVRRVVKVDHWVGMVPEKRLLFALKDSSFLRLVKEMGMVPVIRLKEMSREVRLPMLGSVVGMVVSKLSLMERTERAAKELMVVGKRVIL
jgi:hypothetical protein